MTEEQHIKKCILDNTRFAKKLQKCMHILETLKYEVDDIIFNTVYDKINYINHEIKKIEEGNKIMKSNLFAMQKK